MQDIGGAHCQVSKQPLGLARFRGVRGAGKDQEPNGLTISQHAGNGFGHRGAAQPRPANTACTCGLPACPFGARRALPMRFLGFRNTRDKP